MEISSDEVADHRLSCEDDGLVCCADHKCPCPGVGIGDRGVICLGELADAVARHRREFRLDLPEHWPPQPGDIWQDNRGRRWACQHPAAFGSWAAKTDLTEFERDLAEQTAPSPAVQSWPVRMIL